MARGPLPPLPAGRYRLFADVVHESGFQRTFVDSLTLAAPLRGSAARLDRDDAWYTGPLTAVSSAAPLGDQITLAWAGDPQPVVGRTGVLRFTLQQPSGEPVMVEPYLGMAGHAVVIRDDGKVYVHLHPSGTSAMASAFELDYAGHFGEQGIVFTPTDVQARLQLRAALPDDDGTAGNQLTAEYFHTQPLRDISFPYAFPSPGRYRVWVQLRVRDSVRTAGFEVAVKR